MNIARLILNSVSKQGKISPIQNNTLRTIYYGKLCVNNNDNNTNLIRLVSTCEVKKIKKESLLRQILKKIPFLNVHKMQIKATSFLLYEGIADNVNYASFFEYLKLPDTFYSWFVITELHIWMLSVRGMAEGKDGRHMRNCLVEAFWEDVAQRVKKLGAGNPSEMRYQVAELSEQLQAALIAYDEGLQSDDTVLAGALWRRFYQLEAADPHCLEKLVKYVRKQITILDNKSKEQVFDSNSKPFSWDSGQK